MVDQVIFQVNTFCSVFAMLFVRDISQHSDARADVLQRSCSPHWLLCLQSTTRTRTGHDVSIMWHSSAWQLRYSLVMESSLEIARALTHHACVFVWVCVCVTVSKNSPMEMSPHAINDIVSTTAMCICTWSPSCYRPIRVNCALCAVTDSDV